MDEDQEICRVCRSESTPDHPLYHPCKCSGSIRFVHEDCLIEWLSHSKKKYCELCEYPFTFSPIYREDMPEKVPFYVLCSQLVNRLVSLLKTCFRGLTVLIVWLVILPNFTLWTWRFYFWSGENIGFNTHTSDILHTNRTEPIIDGQHDNSTVSALNESHSFLLSTLKSFLRDCLEGQVITAFVIIIFVAAYLFREWVMQNLPAEQPNVQIIDDNVNQQNGNNDQIVQEQVAIDTLLNAMQVLQPTGADPVPNEAQMRRQLHQMRVDLENERAIRNNQDSRPSAWSPTVDERVSYSDENYLFGGLDGEGSSSSRPFASSSSSSAAAAGHGSGSSNSDAISIHDEDEDEDERDSAYMHHIKVEHDENEVHGFERLRHHHEHQQEEEDHEDRWPSARRYDDEWEDENSLPDLIDENERRLNEERLGRILRERLDGDAGNRAFLDAFDRQLRERREQNPQDRVQEPAAGIAAAAAAAAAVAQDDDEPLDVGDDINGVLEAIGMRGNPWMLVQNSVLMSLMISLCLGVAVWIPYVVGRLVILIRPISFIETPIYVMRLITDPLVDFVLDLCVPFVWSHVKAVMPQSVQVALESAQKQLAHVLESVAVSSHNSTTVASTNITAAAATTTAATAAAVMNETAPLATRIGSDSLMMNMDWAFIQSKAETYSALALARWHRFATGQTALDRSMCIFVGYLVLIGLGSWYLTHGRRRSNRRGAGGASASETIQDLIRQQGIFLKVLFFILIELVVFPTVCGFLLDMATLPLFANASFSSRYVFHSKSPYSSYFLHWFLGTGVLFYFAIFITVCREIVRPGVMWFIRDPNDPQFHPVQEMVERPLPNLLHKISQSALIYSVMLVFGVGTVTYSLAYTGVVFPLRLPFNAPLSTLALDLLIIQFLLPPLIALIKPRDYSKKALDFWWHFASRQLRLTSFMFNERKPDEEGRHVRRTLKSFLLFEKATEIPTDDVAIVDEDSAVVFQRDGMLVRVPKYDSVPVDPKRRMLVPVDPVTLEAIDEEERVRGHPAAADTMDESQATIVVYIPPYFKQRVIVFLLYMWFSISVFACSVTVVPLLFGRLLFKVYLAPEAKVNDLYSFALGIYLMTGCVVLVGWVKECYSVATNSSQEDIMTYMKQKGLKVAKFVYLSSMFGIVIPLLFGVAVDLFVFMPIRNFTLETGLVIHVSQNWSFGVAYMSIIHNLILVLPANNRLRQKLNQITGEGIMQADLAIITRTVIVPVILVALLAITIPGIASWAILQMLDPNDPSLQITVTRYTYPTIFGIFVILLLAYSVKKLINIWMETVRDDTYLIGKKLHNMQETTEETTTATTTTDTTTTTTTTTTIDNA